MHELSAWLCRGGRHQGQAEGPWEEMWQAALTKGPVPQPRFAARHWRRRDMCLTGTSRQPSCEHLKAPSVTGSLMVRYHPQWRQGNSSFEAQSLIGISS